MTAQVSEFQIPRNSLAWLLVAQAAVIAPHVTRLVPWIILVWIGCALWRIMVFTGRWSYPGRWTKALFVFAGMIGVPLGYRTILGIEPAIALLIVAFVLKLLEMQNKRDAYIVIYLAFFVAITEFLFYQSIPASLYIGFVMILITTALIGLNQTRGHLRPIHSFRLAAVLLLQSVPLMVVLFVLFPRVAPLWTVPLPSQTGKTGISDSMTPGDIANLTRSDDLAFRVTFAGEVPPSSQLYWRGLVFTDFDGQKWEQSKMRFGRQRFEMAKRMNAPWDRLIERHGDIVEYSVIMEPTYQNWLFALPTPVPLTEGTALTRDFRLFSMKPIQKRFRYEVRSYLDNSTEKELSRAMRYRMQLLPEEGNPVARSLALRMYGQSGNTQAYIDRVLTMFNQEEFVYTLRPPLLGDDSVDEFLMETRRGFCEHFAGSFVFLMRAVGIPARVVVGYQGGEYNPIGNYVAVHQFDAHAWTEVWIEGEGWRRVDPTSAVAPERIEDGLEAAVSGEDSFLENSPLSWLKYRQALWLTDIRLQLSAIEHYWDTWIVGYNPTMQMRLLEQYMGHVTPRKIAFALLGGSILAMSIVGLVLLTKPTARLLDPATREYLKFCHILARQGVERLIGEGPNNFAERVARQRPHLGDAARSVSDIYVSLIYKQDDTFSLQDLKKAIRSFRMRSLAVNA